MDPPHRVLAPAEVRWDEDRPFSVKFDDVYHGAEGTEETERVFLEPAKFDERVAGAESVHGRRARLRGGPELRGHGAALPRPFGGAAALRGLRARPDASRGHDAGCSTLGRCAASRTRRCVAAGHLRLASPTLRRRARAALALLRRRAGRTRGPYRATGLRDGCLVPGRVRAASQSGHVERRSVRSRRRALAPGCDAHELFIGGHRQAAAAAGRLPRAARGSTPAQVAHVAGGFWWPMVASGVHTAVGVHRRRRLRGMLRGACPRGTRFRSGRARYVGRRRRVGHSRRCGCIRGCSAMAARRLRCVRTDTLSRSGSTEVLLELARQAPCSYRARTAIRDVSHASSRRCRRTGSLVLVHARRRHWPVSRSPRKGCTFHMPGWSRVLSCAVRCSITRGYVSTRGLPGAA